MDALGQPGLGRFPSVWATTWLRRAAYRHGPATGLLGRWIGRGKATDPAADYFARLAEIPDLPQAYRVRALAIVMHLQKQAALRQLVVADEA